jgi:hypothetical protein
MQTEGSLKVLSAESAQYTSPVRSAGNIEKILDKGLKARPIFFIISNLPL